MTFVVDWVLNNNYLSIYTYSKHTHKATKSHLIMLNSHHRTAERILLT